MHKATSQQARLAESHRSAGRSEPSSRSVGRRQSHHKIPRDKAGCSGDVWADSHIHAASVSSGRRSVQSACSTDTPLLLHGSGGHRDQDSTREPEALPSGREAGAIGALTHERPAFDPDESAVALVSAHSVTASPALHMLTQNLREWTLANDSNMCYMNSSIQSILWSLRHHPCSAPLVAIVPVSAHGLLRDHMSHLHSLWQSASNLYAQNDPAEYIPFILNQLVTSWGSWESRLQIDGIWEVQDEASLSSPVVLPFFPSSFRVSELSLASLLQHWHQQVHLFALMNPGEIVLLQLPRFTYSAGHLLSLTYVLDIGDPDAPIELPLWDLTGPVFRPYLLQAIILHYGASPNSGHYMCLLKDGDSWICKNDSAVHTLRALSSDHLKHAYLLFLSPLGPVPFA